MRLDDHVYDDIGRAVKAVARSYRHAYEASLGQAKFNGADKANAAKATSKKRGSKPRAKA